MRNSLVGRWVNFSTDGWYKNGQIILALITGHHLVKWRVNGNIGGPPLTELLRNDDFCTDESKDRAVAFFDTEAELDAWVAWMNEPSEKTGPRVVPIKKE